jgi:hypothetical protein
MVQWSTSKTEFRVKSHLNGNPFHCLLTVTIWKYLNVISFFLIDKWPANYEIIPQKVTLNIGSCKGYFNIGDKRRIRWNICIHILKRNSLMAHCPITTCGSDTQRLPHDAYLTSSVLISRYLSTQSPVV